MALLAVALTSAIPQGWMPATSDDGRILLVLCTADGAVETWVDLNEGDPDHHDSDERMSCPFAGTSESALELAFAGPFPLTFPLQARWAHDEFTHRSAGFHWRYDARGPPALS
ncbi:DUF2946 family protein [Tropicibacter sp. Alg240-R139]|uniref:DUF2946 family protein n=1 Tax=Tropicibacter sp. Alg240-R139 TaxID=2305991 RepID=UPI0013DE8BCF|nr:DUF2946 family protein [Tropicibacter sp. Alg240-R139]